MSGTPNSHLAQGDVVGSEGRQSGGTVDAKGGRRRGRETRAPDSLSNRTNHLPCKSALGNTTFEGKIMQREEDRGTKGQSIAMLVVD